MLSTLARNKRILHYYSKTLKTQHPKIYHAAPDSTINNNGGWRMAFKQRREVRGVRLVLLLGFLCILTVRAS